jgi:hypothetical protein
VLKKRFPLEDINPESGEEPDTGLILCAWNTGRWMTILIVGKLLGYHDEYGDARTSGFAANDKSLNGALTCTEQAV